MKLERIQREKKGNNPFAERKKCKMRINMNKKDQEAYDAAGKSSVARRRQQAVQHNHKQTCTRHHEHVWKEKRGKR